MKIFEVIYDSRQTRVIGRQELDPATMQMVYDERANDFVWLQNANDKYGCRVLLQSQVEIDRKQPRTPFVGKKSKMEAHN